MATAAGDIALVEQNCLVEIGVKILFHERVVEVFAPPHEMVNGALRAVSVENFEAVALLQQLIADGTQTIGGLTGEQCRGFKITIYARANEIIGAVIADFENGIGHHISNHHKTARIVGQLFGFLFG